jgi:hypothetical protein
MKTRITKKGYELLKLLWFIIFVIILVVCLFISLIVIEDEPVAKYIWNGNNLIKVEYYIANR